MNSDLVKSNTTQDARTSVGRVLFLTSSVPRWKGDSTTPFVLHLAQDLQLLGWKVNVLAPHAPNAAAKEPMEGVCIERFRYFVPESQQSVCYQGGALVNLRERPSNLLKLPALVLAEFGAVLCRLRTGHYDLIHSHWILPQGFVASLAAPAFSVPHIVTAHGGDVFDLRGTVMTWFKKVALRRADAVTANSRASMDAIRRMSPSVRTLRQIPMGATDMEPNAEAASEIRCRYRDDHGPLLIFVGRLIEEKGVSDIIRSVELLAKKFPSVKALIVGDGQDRSKFDALVLSRQLQTRVMFVGWIPPSEVRNWLRAADIFVAPSRTSPSGWKEAQGLSIVEAMLVGIPVIATRTGGIPDLIKDGETGLLVDEKSPEQIATAIERLAFDKSLGKRLTASAQVHARKQYTRAHSAAAFSKLYCDVIERRQYQRSHLEIEQD